MKKLIMLAALAAIAAGCATKSRSFDAKGMCVSDSGQLAVGYVHVDAIPDGTDSAVIHYEEDVALLSPSTKTHDISIILTGTNSVGSAKGVVTAICKAFVAVAPLASKDCSDCKTATSPIDLAKSNAENKKTVGLAKVAAGKALATRDTASTTSTDAAAACADGSCNPGGACANGACTDKD